MSRWEPCRRLAFLLRACLARRDAYAGPAQAHKCSRDTALLPVQRPTSLSLSFAHVPAVCPPDRHPGACRVHVAHHQGRGAALDNHAGAPPQPGCGWGTARVGALGSRSSSSALPLPAPFPLKSVTNVLRLNCSRSSNLRCCPAERLLAGPLCAGRHHGVTPRC